MSSNLWFERSLFKSESVNGTPSFIFNGDLPPEKLSNFGYDHRPAAYKIELNELIPMEDNER